MKNQSFVFLTPMNFSPVALFVYNRPLHTLATLEALKHCDGALATTLYIFSDGCKSVHDRHLVDEVRMICRSASGFQQVELIERNQNIGLAANIIDGVSQVIQRHGQIIVLEDDLVASPGFLLYMNQALDFYKNQKVFSVCGYTPPVSVPENYEWSTYLTHRIGSWGWATWQEMWQLSDWDVKAFDAFITNRTSRRRFNQSGNDLTMMLLKQQQGLIRSWAVRFAFSGFQHGLSTVYPVKSLITNCGVDGSGTHMKRSNKYTSQVVDHIDVSLFCPADTMNNKILINFKRFYDTSLYRKMINFLKLHAYLIRK